MLECKSLLKTSRQGTKTNTPATAPVEESWEEVPPDTEDALSGAV